MPIVGDRIKANLTELRFRGHMPATNQVMANATKYATQIAAANKGGKILIFKSKFSGF